MQSLLFSVSGFIFGLIVGSFLNVIIIRSGIGKGNRSRSMCLSCAHSLSASELFPIISYLALRGRCRHCQSKISLQYPLVEIFTGLLFVFSFWHAYDIRPISLAIFDAVSLALSSAVLVVIFVYDLRHKIINNLPVIILSAILLLRILVIDLNLSDQTYIIYDLISGPLAALPFFLLWLLSGGRWMGLGDAKLQLGLGWLIGWHLWFPAMVLGFWIGATAILILMLFQKVVSKLNSDFIRKLPILNLKTEVPFAPFLIVAALISFFLNFNVLSAVSAFFL